MRTERTQHEQDQVNRGAVEAMRSSWRWERQNVYRLCPVGMWVDHAHFARDLARNDGTPRSNLAHRYAMVTAVRGLGNGPDGIAAALGRSVEEVSRLLGPIPIWSEGAARLAAIEAQEREMLARPRLSPPPSELPPGVAFPNANTDGTRTLPGSWRNSGGRENRARP